MRRSGALALVLALAGCADQEPPAVTVACAAITPTGVTTAEAGAGDPLELIVVFDSVPASGGVRLRVDALRDPGVVAFAAPSPTSAAAGMTLDVPAQYQGCAGLAPFGLELRAPFPPRGKAWVWVSTDRVVRLRVRAGDRTTDPAIAAPGESALVEWGAAQ